MRKENIISTLAILALTIVISPAFAEDNDCRFDLHIDRSIRQWSDRPIVFGWVSDCRAEAGYGNIPLAYTSNVQLKIIDSEGNLVAEDKPSQFKYQPWKEATSRFDVNSIINGGETKIITIDRQVWTIYPTGYLSQFEMVSSVDFESYQVYYVEATYGSLVRTVPFLIID